MSDDLAGPRAPAVYRLRTVIVDGPLALRMRRLQAARQNELGLQIFSLPQLGARLAGGFARPALIEDLERAAREALAEGGFAEIHALAELPGTVRALVRTLERLWRAGVCVGDHTGDHSRLADLALLEARVRRALAGGALAAPDLARTAIDRIAFARAVFGELTFERVHWVAPVWRPLIEALADVLPVRWRDCAPPPELSAGEQPEIAAATNPAMTLETCAHPQAEVTEALRWVRALLASGQAEPQDVALGAASPSMWDDTFLGLAAGAGLPIHFSHGVPALATVDGQACAALSELLSQGLSYDRVRRVVSHGTGRGPAMMALPEAPLAGIPTAATLTTLEQWRTALDSAAPQRRDGIDVRPVLLPVLELVVRGLPVAEAAGAQLLPRGGAKLWTSALRGAPAAALPFTLAGLRVPDGRDPGANVVWTPASHLAGAPRPWTRLLGMTSRAWPRPRQDDPLLPEHIFLSDRRLLPSRPDEDRRLFEMIQNGVSKALVFSYGRRSPQGGAQAPSPLLPKAVSERRLGRMRVPEHAYSEGDRLQARREEASGDPSIARPIAYAKARRQHGLTPFDGVVRPDHPVILEALTRVQSASSLRWLLRDPQAFVWRYALGWLPSLGEASTLELSDRAFGELVHELLQDTVRVLELGPGFGRAAEHEIEAALALAVDRVTETWPTVKPTPPPVLWRHTLAMASRMALHALTLDGEFQSSTRSWTEAPFGDPGADPQSAPWDPQIIVTLPETEFRIGGRIDRLDIAAGETAVRITDYKTGRKPANVDALVLGGGAELQRVLYAAAVRQHFPDARIRADLVYLADDDPKRHPLANPDATVGVAAKLLNAGADLLRRGMALPGPDARERWNPYRLARPAIGEPQLKGSAIADAFGSFENVWEAP